MTTMESKRVLIRTAAIPKSIRSLLTGQLKYMTEYYDVIALTSNAPDYQTMLDEQCVRGYVVPFTRKAITPISDIRAVIKLIHIYRKEKPFIVHSHTTKDGMLCMFTAWLCGVSNRFYTLCGSLLDMKGMKGVLARCGERLTMACSTKVFSISNNMMEQYIAAGFVRRDKIKVLLNGSSNGFDIDYFNKTSVSEEIIDAAYKECGLKEGQFVFCTVGRIVHDKGINELVAAFKRLLVDYKNVQLLLVGSYEEALDPIKAETKKEIESNPNIHNVGWKNDVRPYMILSDMLIHPSHREGFGNVIAQACLLETPCIVTDICGPNEIIIEGVNGTIFPPKDEDALYEKMKYFVEHKEEIQKLGCKARESITSRFSRKAIWKAILAEYKLMEK